MVEVVEYDSKNILKNIFLQNIPLIIFNYDQFVANGKFKGLKHQLSSQITEKWLNHVSKLGMSWKSLFPKYSPDDDKQFQSGSKFHKK